MTFELNHRVREKASGLRKCTPGGGRKEPRQAQSKVGANEMREVAGEGPSSELGFHSE